MNKDSKVTLGLMTALLLVAAGAVAFVHAQPTTTTAAKTTTFMVASEVQADPPADPANNTTTDAPPVDPPVWYATVSVLPPTSPYGSAIITASTFATNNGTVYNGTLHGAFLFLDWDPTQYDLGANALSGLNDLILAHNDTIGFFQANFVAAGEQAQFSVPAQVVDKNGNVTHAVALVLVAPDTGQLVVLGMNGQTAAWTASVDENTGETIGHSWQPTSRAVLRVSP